ncbi:MAG TPA: hypothetical protein VNR70_09970 [Steroidobacteraceae bacterium]|nr:hypothetical protein [Steroidobacteraceae bacterium]
MKYIIIATALTCLISGAANADRNSDTDIQNLRNSVKMAYSSADKADAEGDHVSGVRWRQKAHDLETQLRNLVQQNADDAVSIAGAFSSN